MAELLSHIVMISFPESIYSRLALRKQQTGCFISEFCRRAVKAALDREAAQETVADNPPVVQK
jgi:hypothetical protein